MATISSFRDLLVWQKSMTLAESCYGLARRFPRDEQWVLGREIRKTCISVPSNIAEGFGRWHTAEYVHHLGFANGSNNELQTQLELGRRLSIVSAEDAAQVIADAEEVGKMLNGLMAALRRSRAPNP